MMQTSSTPEVTALIKKHGTTDALFIKNLSYSTNVPLKDMYEIDVESMKTGLRYIAQGLKDNTGLTEAEYTVLTFWSNHLADAKVPFLTAHAHTLSSSRNGPFSKHDLDFIRFGGIEDGDILNLAYEASKSKEQARQSEALGEIEEVEAKVAHFAIVSSQDGTLAAIEATIAALECLRKDFTFRSAFLEEPLQLLRQKREALKK
ncbi:uncharacterized protein FTOL_12091 [Fusarium torulosum]|uniref:Uncharacterized protein n=1 Tax=Fusarium torulosum TaxID=33205 RepID=A0AAE8SNJ7_9HYPO|nr:uncharacterized protein FTOL_12091 [Fusarium torulosum]